MRSIVIRALIFVLKVGINLSDVRNYFNPTPEDAFKSFACLEERVVIRAGRAEEDRWIEVMHEMRPWGILCAVVDANGDEPSLRRRLVSLCVAGVEEITFVGKSRIEVEQSISLCPSHNPP